MSNFDTIGSTSITNPLCFQENPVFSVFLFLFLYIHLWPLQLWILVCDLIPIAMFFQRELFASVRETEPEGVCLDVKSLLPGKPATALVLYQFVL